MAREQVKSFQQALEVLNTQMQPKLAQAGEVISEAKERVESEVRKNPWLFIGVAAALSLIIGFLLGRKSK